MTNKEIVDSAKEICLAVLSTTADRDKESFFAYMELQDSKGDELIPHFRAVRDIMQKALEALGETE